MSNPGTILLLLKRVDCNDGVASYIESLITGLREIGDRVVVVSGEVTALYGSEGRRDRIQAAALDWLVLDGFDASRPSPVHIRQILSVMKRYDVDVVSPQGFAVLPVGALVARLSRTPIVTNFHLLPTFPRGREWLMRLGYRLVTMIARADRYIAISTEIEQFFRSDCRIPQHRIHKQLLAVDTDFYRTPSVAERAVARAELGLDDDTIMGILPARLNLTKGHGIAAAAFRLVRHRRPTPRVVCLFAGAGDMRETIEADVLRDDADRKTFRFLGFVDKFVLRSVYWAADIVVLPSRVEGGATVIAEAMGCGAIVIRTPSGGWQDQVLEGKTGFMVPFDDPAALAIAIEKVIDAPDRDRMREEAMRVASTSFARSGMIAGTSALYRELAGKRHARRVARATSKTTY